VVRAPTMIDSTTSSTTERSGRDGLWTNGEGALDDPCYDDLFAAAAAVLGQPMLHHSLEATTIDQLDAGAHSGRTVSRVPRGGIARGSRIYCAAWKSEGTCRGNDCRTGSRSPSLIRVVRLFCRPGRLSLLPCTGTLRAG
jgi:hypothetical protein